MVEIEAWFWYAVWLFFQALALCTFGGVIGWAVYQFYRLWKD